MDARKFINALRILHSLDRHELVDAGVLQASDLDGWLMFQRNPFRAAMRLVDQSADALAVAIQRRMNQKDHST